MPGTYDYKSIPLEQELLEVESQEAQRLQALEYYLSNVADQAQRQALKALIIEAKSKALSE